ncbi:MAG: hypothetical protein KDA58_03940 [Planctomycetaceae bacterium]|nr:hypothetical protein [Planctomycetaceae bacterium]
MRNQPLSPLDAPTTSSWIDLDLPTARLALLAGMMCLPLVGVALRMVQVQTTLADALLSGWNNTTESTQQLPSRAGRILSADGVVLADVHPRFDLLVDYRWLEEPPHPDWLRREALARLPRTERKNAAARTAAETDVLHDRDALWSQLSELLAVPPSELRQRRIAIQSRIETMRTAVETRRTQQHEEWEIQPLRLADGWTGIWSTLVHELTTPPRRDQDPIILKEELQPHPIATDVPQQVAATVHSLPHRFRGAEVRVADVRTYPQGSLASHVLGLRRPLRPDDEAPPGITSLGESGLERTYDLRLRGQNGERRIVRNRQGEAIEESETRPAIDGHDLQLTLHAQLQQTAERLLDRALEMAAPTIPDDPTDGALPTQPPVGGTLLIMNTRTGELLVAATAPRIDQTVLQHPTTEQWDEIQNDPRRPLFNRLTHAALPPGSVFKLLTSIALLESQTITPDEPRFCQGYLDEPDRNRCYVYRRYQTGHGELMLADALSQSCNVYFFQSARDMGAMPLVTWAARCGFGQPTGIDLPGEAAGHVPHPARLKPGERWYPGSTLQLAIGQGSLTATPLQILRLVAAIANDGILVSPRLVGGSDATAVPDPLVPGSGPQAGTLQTIQGLHLETLTAIRDGMRLAVNHPKGTGRLAYCDEVAIAGKTGTAETGGERPDHAWFAGYLPADAPRYAVVVILEHGGSGGHTAAPIVKQLAQEMFHLDLIPSSRESQARP